VADRFYLNIWLPTFTTAEMLPRMLSVLRQFPFSASRTGIGSLSIHSVAWSEPVIFQQTFDRGAAPEEALGLANDFLHSDYAYEFEAFWDLWGPKIEGDLDARWILQPEQVRFIAYGTEFEDGEACQQFGHIHLDFGLDSPFLHDELEDLDELAEERVKINVQKLVNFTSAVEKNCRISGRVLWSESEETLAQKLISRLQKTQ